MVQPVSHSNVEHAGSGAAHSCSSTAGEPRLAIWPHDREGSLMVRGELDSFEAFDDLKKLVHDSRPPAEVFYSVQVNTPNLRKIMEEFRAKEGTAVNHE
jgi:hypothetical protein